MNGVGPFAGSVDVHAHFVDPAALADMTRLAPELMPVLTERHGVWSATFPNGRTWSIEAGLIDLSVRLRDMDAQGVQHQAVATATSLYLYDAPGPKAAELLAIQNDSIVRTVRKHPDRLVAIAGLPLQDIRLSIKEVERLAPLSEVAGIQIGTNVNGLNLDDDSFEPVWEALEAHNIPVLVHPWGPGPAGKERLTRYNLLNLIGNPLETAIAIASLVFSGVPERHPFLRFCFVHGGGFMPHQLGRWDHGWDIRLRAESPINQHPSEYVRRFYFDLLTHDPGSLRFLGSRFGWSQVLVGTDYPWGMGTKTPIQDLQAAGLSRGELEQVASLNPLEFLRWPGVAEMVRPTRAS